MAFVSVIGGVSYSYSGVVSSLCTYKTAYGRVVWVGECVDGYLYGTAWHLSAVRSLSQCFRFAPNFSTKAEAISRAGLKLCKGDAVPADLVPHIAGAARRFASMPGKKKADLPFTL